MAVPIHVLHPGCGPAREANTAQFLSRGNGCAFRTSQIMDQDLPCRRILKDQIRVAICVEIGSSDNIPSGCRKRTDGFAAQEVRPLLTAVKVDVDLSGSLINKDHIRVTVAIQIRNCASCPFRPRRSQGTEISQNCAVRPAIENDGQGASRTLGIDQALIAVVMEIPDANQYPSRSARWSEGGRSLQMCSDIGVGDDLPGGRLHLIELIAAASCAGYVLRIHENGDGDKDRHPPQNLRTKNENKTHYDLH